MPDRDNRAQNHPPDEASPGKPSSTGKPSVNRRDFLKGSGAAVAVTAIATQAVRSAQAEEDIKPNVYSAKPQKLTLNINGKNYTVEVEPRVTLLEVLRHDLNLTGAKDVDDRSASGADTVMIDGKAVSAGSRLAIECQNQKIRTVESLVAGGKVDDVVAGFVKYDAMQCGFCTPGFVMATRAFLDANPNANDDEIHAGLGGNICRCGTYDGIMKCAREIAKGGA